MNSIGFRAKAKINLSLDITGKRDDGYHNVVMIMQSIELCDIITIKRSENLSIKTNLPYLPVDEKNIALRAAVEFFRAVGITEGAEINLEKRIPVASGLAGGSTDAAAVLKGLNSLYDTGLTDEELCAIALPLGADIPFCIIGGTMLAEGIGEKLTPLRALPGCSIVIGKPPISISTAKIYDAYDRYGTNTHPDTEGMIKSLEKGDLNGVCKRLYNVLEDITARECRDIKNIKRIFTESGAAGTLMSGSGPSVYGLFTDNEKALLCYQRIKKQYKESYMTSVSM